MKTMKVMILVAMFGLAACTEDNPNAPQLTFGNPPSTPTTIAGKTDATGTDAGSTVTPDASTPDAEPVQPDANEPGVDVDAVPDSNVEPDAEPTPDAEPDAPPNPPCEGFVVGGECVECVNNVHCAEGTVCNDEHLCVPEGIVPDPDPVCAEGLVALGDDCVECLNANHCGEGEFCNPAHECELVSLPATAEMTWSTPEGLMENAVVTLHIVNLAMPVEGEDIDGNGAPDPYFTDASCTVDNSPTPWGCGVTQPQSNKHYGVLDDHPAGIYQVAVHYEQHLNPMEQADLTALVRVDLEVEGDIPFELHLPNQALQPGDLWCVAVIDTIVGTIEPCVDADGEPVITPNYPLPVVAE